MNIHLIRSKFVLGLSGLVLLVGAGVVSGVVLTSGGGAADAANNPGAAVPAGEGARLSASLDPASKAAFADDKITNTEYVDATNAYIECVRALGYGVTNPTWFEGRLTYTIGPIATEAELKASKAPIAACYDANLRGIDLVAQSGH